MTRQDVQSAVDWDAFILALRTARMMTFLTKPHVPPHHFFQESPHDPVLVAVATHHRIFLRFPRLKIVDD